MFGSKSGPVEFSVPIEAMSPATRRRIAQQDAAEAREAARDQRHRAAEAEAWQERQVRASVELAISRGEEVDESAVRRREGVGHTPGQFIALAAHGMDLADARDRALQRRAFDDWQTGHGPAPLAAHELTADTSEIEAETAQERVYTAERRTAVMADRKARATARGLANTTAQGIARGIASVVRVTRPLSEAERECAAKYRARR